MFYLHQYNNQGHVIAYDDNKYSFRLMYLDICKLFFFVSSKATIIISNFDELFFGSLGYKISKRALIKTMIASWYDIIYLSFVNILSYYSFFCAAYLSPFTCYVNCCMYIINTIQLL